MGNIVFTYYELFVAGNVIYGCPYGIHVEQWQCNGDRVFSLWVPSVCNCQIKATVGKLSKFISGLKQR